MPRRGENIYKRKDGRYEGRYVIGKREDGKTRFGYVYGYQYTKVRSELSRRRAELDSNRGPSATKLVTLGEWMKRWLTGEMRCRLKQSSYQTYTRLTERYILPLLGEMDIALVTSSTLYDFLAELENRQLSRATQKCVLCLISATMRSAQDEGLIRKNPCAKVKLRLEDKEQRVLNAAEHEKLKAASLAAKDVPALLGLYTGMRIGEICALQWSDIDWQAKTISVRHTVQRMYRTNRKAGEPKTELGVSSPKSSSSRRILPVPDMILDMLKALEKTSDSPYVFGSKGHACDPRATQRRFQRMAEELNLSGVHFHTTRHTFATRMLEIGVDVKTVSTMLGHSSTQTTLDFYAHSMIDQQRQALDRLMKWGKS